MDLAGSTDYFLDNTSAGKGSFEEGSIALDTRASGPFDSSNRGYNFGGFGLGLKTNHHFFQYSAKD